MSPAIPSSLELTRSILSFDTVNPPGQERACARYLGGILERAGLSVSYSEFAEGRTSLIATLAGSGLPICFTGHLDTVPLGAAPWSRDPFRGEIDGDRMYGRGASDMKSGVAAMAIMALRLADIRDRRAGVTLIITAGEETCLEGASHLASTGRLGAPAGALVVGEPTSNQPVIAHKGCVRFRIRTRGVTAHASMPDLGDNAIHKAADAVGKLRGFRFGAAPHGLLGVPTLSIGTISGGANINSVPDRTDIGIDIRTVPGQDDETIRRALSDALGADVEIERLDSASPVETDPNAEWIGTVLDVMTRYQGQRPVPAGVPYFTDASVLTPALGHPPTVILGPGEAAQAHKTDEYCLVPKLEEAVEIYTDLATRWCT